MLKSFLPSFTLLLPYIFPSLYCLDPNRLLPRVFFHLVSQTLTEVNQGSTLHEVNIPKPYIPSIFTFSLWHPMLSAFFYFFFRSFLPFAAAAFALCSLFCTVLSYWSYQTKQEEVSISFSHLLCCLSLFWYFTDYTHSTIFFIYFYSYIFFSSSRNVQVIGTHFRKARWASCSFDACSCQHTCVNDSKLGIKAWRGKRGWHKGMPLNITKKKEVISYQFCLFKAITIKKSTYAGGEIFI